MTDQEIIQEAEFVLDFYKIINVNMTVEEAKAVLRWEAKNHIQHRPSRRFTMEAA